jgi:hypothetical protein
LGLLRGILPLLAGSRIFIDWRDIMIDFEKDIIELYHDLKAIYSFEADIEFISILTKNDEFTFSQARDVLDYVKYYPSALRRFRSETQMRLKS